MFMSYLVLWDVMHHVVLWFHLTLHFVRCHNSNVFHPPRYNFYDATIAMYFTLRYNLYDATIAMYFIDGVCQQASPPNIL